MADNFSPAELYWRSKQPWLKTHGYELRPRYQPDWVPSWITNPPEEPVIGLLKREDYRWLNAPTIIDATRVKDGVVVILKKIHKLGNSYDQEAEISLYLSSSKLAGNSGNHCVPIYEMLEIPDDNNSAILVMPLLRHFSSPRFDTIGECMDFFQLIFKGLQFIHQHNIAHCNDVLLNKMYTRTQRPPRYYWIDFGNSARFDPSNKAPRIAPLHGTDKSAPDFRRAKSGEELDPFPTDIYYLGNLLRLRFTEGFPYLGYPRIYGLDFLKPLIDDMCVVRLDGIIRQQGSWTLRSQVWCSNDNIFGIIYRLCPHWARRLYYIVTRATPIPQGAD
ncbi:hypothetical protein BDN70DRAFT_905842 [Pholiota conissans]|uniref:Protein kinase domain-containing protein n=1 Tax=Pholiota conissans TaxID=109636 RepID=A0A9P5Z2M4_9AGAR|nr:hypothetical protein BDN70DRAFT_905842 [Pholiota conissans]